METPNYDVLDPAAGDFMANYTATGFRDLGAVGPVYGVSGGTGLTEILMVQTPPGGPEAQVSTPSSLDSVGFNMAYGNLAPAAP